MCLAGNCIFFWQMIAINARTSKFSKNVHLILDDRFSERITYGCSETLKKYSFQLQYVFPSVTSASRPRRFGGMLLRFLSQISWHENIFEKYQNVSIHSTMRVKFCWFNSRIIWAKILPRSFPENFFLDGFFRRNNMRSRKLSVLDWYLCEPTTPNTSSEPSALHWWGLLKFYWFRKIIDVCEKLPTVKMFVIEYDFFFWDKSPLPKAYVFLLWSTCQKILQFFSAPWFKPNQIVICAIIPLGLLVGKEWFWFVFPRWQLFLYNFFQKDCNGSSSELFW